MCKFNCTLHLEASRWACGQEGQTVEGAERQASQEEVLREATAQAVQTLSQAGLRPGGRGKTRSVSDPPAEPLDPNLFGASSPCFGCSPAHPIGLRLRFERVGDAIVTRYVPPEQFQGPPGVLHGGLATTLADEIAAWTVVGLRHRFGFTGAIDARLRRPIRIGREVVGRGHIAEDRGRVVKVAVTLHQDDALALEGRFTFALLDRAAAERLLGAELPEAWRRLARD